MDKQHATGPAAMDLLTPAERTIVERIMRQPVASWRLHAFTLTACLFVLLCLLMFGGFVSKIPRDLSYAVESLADGDPVSEATQRAVRSESAQASVPFYVAAVLWGSVAVSLYLFLHFLYRDRYMDIVWRLARACPPSDQSYGVPDAGLSPKEQRFVLRAAVPVPHLQRRLVRVSAIMAGAMVLLASMLILTGYYASLHFLEAGVAEPARLGDVGDAFRAICRFSVYSNALQTVPMLMVPVVFCLLLYISTYHAIAAAAIRKLVLASERATGPGPDGLPEDLIADARRRAKFMGV